MISGDGDGHGSGDPARRSERQYAPMPPELQVPAM
jgi:hypothetical protein